MWINLPTLKDTWNVDQPILHSRKRYDEDGIDMTLDVYMTFENGSWVIDAYQADVDHDEVKVID